MKGGVHQGREMEWTKVERRGVMGWREGMVWGRKEGGREELDVGEGGLKGSGGKGWAGGGEK